MPDFLLKGIDIELATQIKDMAQQKSMPINEYILDVIRKGLAQARASFTSGSMNKIGMIEERDVSNLHSVLDTDEDAALRAALAALENLPEDTSPFAGRKI